MDKVVIEINGVRHALVKNSQKWEDCNECSLCDFCREHWDLLCNLFEDGDFHYEIEPTIPQL